MPDIDGDELEQLAGRDRLRARQVPHATDRALVGAERRQTGGDVRDVAVGVGQVGVADEVSAFAGDARCRTLARRAMTQWRPAPKKSDARPIAIRTRPASAAASSSWVIAARVRPLTVVAASGRSSVIGSARGRAVAVDVLEAHQQRTVALGRAQHSALQRREALRPVGVRRVQTLVDDRRALGRRRRRRRVGRVSRPPIDPIGQRRRPAPRHRPHRQPHPGQAARSERARPARRRTPRAADPHSCRRSSARRNDNLLGLARSAARRTPARSWKPATAVPSSSTPAARPVVATSAVPDIVATRITGPTVNAHPTGR